MAALDLTAVASFKAPITITRHDAIIFAADIYREVKLPKWCRRVEILTDQNLRLAIKDNDTLPAALVDGAAIGTVANFYPQPVATEPRKNISVMDYSTQTAQQKSLFICAVAVGANITLICYMNAYA